MPWSSYVFSLLSAMCGLLELHACVHQSYLFHQDKSTLLCTTSHQHQLLVLVTSDNMCVRVDLLLSALQAKCGLLLNTSSPKGRILLTAIHTVCAGCRLLPGHTRKAEGLQVLSCTPRHCSTCLARVCLSS